MRRSTPKKNFGPAPRLWRVFKLKSGEIRKAPGTEVRDCGDAYQVWDQRIYQMSVAKNYVADSWDQDTKDNPREKLGSPMMKQNSDTGRVPNPGDKIKIPLSAREAVRLLGKVKPTADMPRPGASGKKKAAKPPIKKRAAQTGKRA